MLDMPAVECTVAMSVKAETESQSSFVCRTRNHYFTRQLIIDVLIWFFVCIPVLAFFICGRPHVQGFYCKDPDISLPYQKNTISTPALLATGLAVPFALFILTELINITSNRTFTARKRSQLEMMVAMKGFGIFLFGTMVNKVFTEVTKYSIGRLRPNFLDVCRPLENINCTKGTYISKYECTDFHSSFDIRDSRLSFPSGHASFALFCSVFTVLYIQVRLRVDSSYFLKPTIQSAVLLLSVWCCHTRITDHKHFPSDVITGCFFGVVSAWLTFYKIAAPVLEAAQEKRAELERGYSVNSNLEPTTPAPLLKKSRQHTCSFYLDDPPSEKDRT